MLIFLLTIAISNATYAQNNGDSYQSKKKWVKILNKSIHHEGHLYAYSSEKCIINESQELRVIDQNKNEVLIRLVGTPSRTGTSCPSNVVFKMQKSDLVKYEKITDMKSSNYCKLPQGEHIYIDTANDININLGGRSNFSTSLLIAESQCSIKNSKDEMINNSFRGSQKEIPENNSIPKNKNNSVIKN